MYSGHEAESVYDNIEKVKIAYPNTPRNRKSDQIPAIIYKQMIWFSISSVYKMLSCLSKSEIDEYLMAVYFDCGDNEICLEGFNSSQLKEAMYTIETIQSLCKKLSVSNSSNCLTVYLDWYKKIYSRMSAFTSYVDNLYEGEDGVDDDDLEYFFGITLCRYE